MEGYTCLGMWNILLNWNVFFETTNLTNSKNLEEKWQIIIVDYPLGGRNYERAPLSSLCEKYVRYSHFHPTWKFLTALSVLRPTDVVLIAGVRSLIVYIAEKGSGGTKSIWRMEVGDSTNWISLMNSWT